MVAMLNWLHKLRIRQFNIATKPKSNCSYFFTFNLKPTSNGSIRSPCTNRPIVCEICNECIWSYNINYHYQSKHNLNDVPNELKITEDEKKRVLSGRF